MAVNWDKPVNADPYDTGILPVINEKVEGAATMDFAGDTNVPTGAIRYNTTTDQLERYDGASWIEVLRLPKNYIGGLITSNDAGDVNHDVNITAGEARGLADDANLRLASEITKQIDAAWAVGDDAGGIDAGAVAVNTMYGIWIIKRTDTGVVDVLFSTSFTAPTMPANYDKKRLIGAVKTEASADIIAFTQSGDYFRYTSDVVIDVTDNTIVDDVFETDTLSVPPSCLAFIYGHLSNPTTTGDHADLWIRTKDAADAGSLETFLTTSRSGSVFKGQTKEGSVLVNSARQIEYAATEDDGEASVQIATKGFLMFTRREP